jgi:hypothetical protein
VSGNAEQARQNLAARSLVLVAVNQLAQTTYTVYAVCVAEPLTSQPLPDGIDDVMLPLPPV